MITVAQKEQIRTAHYRGRKSIRQIAREYHHSRKTIRKALQDASPPRYTRNQPPPYPVLGQFLQIIERLLTGDLTAPRKQRHTARRIFQRLRDEWGYQGCESTVRRYVRLKKAELGQGREVYLPMAHPPDGQAVVDWTPAMVKFKGVLTAVYLFLMKLEHSQKKFVRAYPCEKQECFFDGHAGAFELFRGVPPRIRYDSVKTAVKRVLTGRKREEQEAFIAFRSHYLFQSDFCSAGRAHEKGGVENLAGYAKRNFLTPVPEVESFEDLNRHLLQRCVEEDDRIPQGMHCTIAEAFEEERGSMAPLSPRRFECCRMVPATVDSQSRVVFDGNRYSVPIRFAYRQVMVKGFAWEVAICAGKEVIARHARCWGRGEQLLDPLHYLRMLERKPAGLDRGLPFYGWKLPGVFPRFRRVLEARSPQGTKQYIQLLRLLEKYSLEDVTRALTRAEQLRAWDVDCVVNLLMSPQGEPSPRDAMGLGSRTDLMAVSGYRADISLYDALLGERR